MRVTYDPESDVLAIELRGGVAPRGRQVAAGIVLLQDEQGAVVGIEVLDASKRIDGSPAQVSLEILSESVPV